MTAFIEAIGPFLIIAAALLMYVLLVQIMNDTACVALDASATPIFGKGLLKFLFMCW